MLVYALLWRRSSNVSATSLHTVKVSRKRRGVRFHRNVRFTAKELRTAARLTSKEADPFSELDQPMAPPFALS